MNKINGASLTSGSKILRDGDPITILEVRQPSPPAVVVWFKYLREDSLEPVVGYCGIAAEFETPSIGAVQA